MRRSFRTRRFGSRGRRKMAWGRGFAADSGLGPVPVGNTLIQSFWYKIPASVLNTSTPPNGAIEPEDWTLIRTICSVQIQYSTASSADASGIFPGAGLIVWEQNTDDVPLPTRIPGPIANGDADWIWNWNAATALTGGGNSSGTIVADNKGDDQFIFTKAKRKLSSRQGILCVLELNNAAGASSVNFDAWAFYGRSLFKLP